VIGFLQRMKVPHVFTLLTGVVFICSLLTFIVPSGEYERETLSVGGRDRTVVVPDTYQTLTKHISAKGLLFQDEAEGMASTVSLEEFLSAIPLGMVKAADIIFLIFIVGGVFGILQATGTIPAVLGAVLNRLRSSWKLLTIVLMTAMAIGGSTLGMGEEFIPLVPIFLIVAKEIGCDRIFGVALVYVAGAVGFAAATTNPFTVNIAQEIAGLPLNSAISFRLFFLVACLAVTLVYMLRYGRRIRRDPSTSLMADDDFVLPTDNVEPPPLRGAHVVILIACAAIFVFIIYAVQEMGWWLTQMAGGFILMGIVATAISRLPVRQATLAAVKGMEEMTVAALVVGFARGVTVVLENGQILDTLIFSAAAVLQRYLREGRPASDRLELFTRVIAPAGALTRGAIAEAFRRQVRRSGLPLTGASPYGLRHSFAMRLLGRNVGVKAIGDLLGHRSLEATSVYLRLQTDALRDVALPLPGGRHDHR